MDDERRPALYTIGARTATRTGAPNIRLAKILAQQAVRSGISKQQFKDGYLLRGLKAGKRWQAQVLDFPSYLFMGSIDQTSIVLECYPVGQRDDFEGKGGSATFAIADYPQHERLRIPGVDLLTGGVGAFWQARPSAEGESLTIGELYPLFSTNPPNLSQWYYDDPAYFTLASQVYAAVGLRRFWDGGTSTTGVWPITYGSTVSFVVSEANMPDEWLMMPRRRDDLSNSGYPSRSAVADFMPGIASAAADDDLTVMEGTDYFCIATPTFRQYPDLWQEAPDKPTYFDRDGERGLAVAVGSYDRTSYLGGVADAALDSVLVTDGFSLVDYLQPTPPSFPADSDTGKPELINFGAFWFPTPLRIDSGFVTFSVYTTLRDTNVYPTDDTYTEDKVGTATTVVAILPGGGVTTIKADWDVPQITGTIETGTDNMFTQPYIIGGVSLQNDEGSYVAYCLVWEMNYPRVGGNAVSGNWALYRCAGGVVTRTTIQGRAPLVSAYMFEVRDLPKRTTFREYLMCPTAVYSLGKGKLVTAGCDNPLATGPRDIRPIFIDVATGALTTGGVITQTSSDYPRCIITVVGEEQDDTPAVLLAGVSTDLVGYNGKGATYISVDGGDTWRTYVTDNGGMVGPFMVGNHLWKYDKTKVIK